jgi:hypothetical protein
MRRCSSYQAYERNSQKKEVKSVTYGDSKIRENDEDAGTGGIGYFPQPLVTEFACSHIVVSMFQSSVIFPLSHKFVS